MWTSELILYNEKGLGFNKSMVLVKTDAETYNIARLNWLELKLRQSPSYSWCTKEFICVVHLETSFHSTFLKQGIAWVLMYKSFCIKYINMESVKLKLISVRVFIWVVRVVICLLRFLCWNSRPLGLKKLKRQKLKAEGKSLESFNITGIWKRTRYKEKSERNILCQKTNLMDNDTKVEDTQMS